MLRIGKFVGGILPALIGIALVAIEMLYSRTLSPPAINVITALQFGCSLWFGAGVAYLYTEAGFLEKQKKFAISAYRRISEIEKNVRRLLSRFNARSSSKTKANELEVIKEVLLSLQTTISSSKADWADVIGEEIKTLERLLRLREDDDVPSVERNAETEALLRELPSSLEIEAREDLRSDERIDLGVDQIQEEFMRHGYIEFECFWDNSFARDIDTLELGEAVRVEVDDVNDRVGAFIVHDKQGVPVGVVTNKGLGSNTYDEFIQILTTAFRKSRFSAIYSGRDRTLDAETERHYFSIKSSDLEIELESEE